MTCQPTDTPPADSFDIDALRARYRLERDKRVNRATTDQYVRATGDFEEIYEADPHSPVVARLPIEEDLDVAILGGGWTGVLAAYHLGQRGVSTFRVIDHAGGFGGVWYWNRYPGLSCDNDAYCYLPLLEETGFMPSKKFADGYEIRAYMNTIADRFGLGENALFHTRVTGLRWDDAIQRWHVTTDRGDDIRARFVIMANGLLNIPKLPGVPGIADFKGKIFHTGRWDYDYTGGTPEDPALEKLADKRVAIIGTGATAVQAVPFLGRHAAQLYVIQRTPSTVDKRVNPPTDPEWVKTLEPGWQKARQENFHRAAMERFRPGEPDLICDIWTEISRNMSAELAAEGWPDIAIGDYYARREVVDYRVMERLRARVDELVDDPATAESLKPWYRFLCKRPASNDAFYPTFNRPNVTLIDVAATRGVERLTEQGFVANGTEYPIDCLIFASGFEASSSLDRRWGIAEIVGRDGVSLYDHWRDGFTSLHGMMTRGFPNMFFTGYVQSALNSSTTEQMSRHDYHIAYIIRQAMERGAVAVEPSADEESAWVAHIRETAVDASQFLSECTPSYFNGENSEKPKSYAGEPYGPGWHAFEALLQAWRDAGDLRGLELTPPARGDA
ncbi:NAD(P)/FAD-dependent oxidoreductase [Sphingomonas naphthae]|uniref:NAD(P)/FAD-dependent oxidoreductase n=1 Tax=Sphingomonas naphthae TaxID=1813468 RepID=A0ABY7TTH4_9SPHN|nr:NAD(P)/FAD-dependent oxidoreductase [Sphingomonas naphthae]WCT75174.1 NAD(P)/FAD-dependent oxidoreductase [Sphingomonas naphthae]